MDDDEDDVPTCPLCLEELDATDRAVKACQCGYQVCLWCLHTIRERLNRRCPACRTLYEEQNFKFDDVNPEQAAKEAKERKTAKKERERREKLQEIERERARAIVLSQQKAKSNLKHVRILQRNLVYVIGLSLTLAREEVIRRSDMFAKYGKMMRILVNRSHPFNADAPGGPSISAYVQYYRDADALAAVRAMNNAVFDGREIRCAIATTKYCDTYVRNVQTGDPAATYHCGNAHCMYYHTTSQSDSILAREDVLARQLGPPPPAHLFLPAAPRRPPFPQLQRSQGPQSPVQSTTQALLRPLPSRTQINSTSSSLPTTASIMHPLSTSLPNVSPSVPVPTTAAASTSSFSPLATSPRTPTAPSVTANVSSPQWTPPLSPHDEQSSLSKSTRSPTRCDISAPQSPSVALKPTAPSAPTVPLSSSAAWASTQPGHPVSRSPVRRSTTPLADEPSHSRSQTLIRRARDAPPGFEDSSPQRSPASDPSQPPGFGTPPSRPTETTAKPSTSTPLLPLDPPSSVLVPKDTPHASSSLSIPPTNTGAVVAPSTPTAKPLAPPGFGPSVAGKTEKVEETRQQVAAAWSQEASADEVFSIDDRRKAAPVGGLGSCSPAMSQDGDHSRAGLEKVLASIGGSLGVSSEFQTVPQVQSPRHVPPSVAGTVDSLSAQSPLMTGKSVPSPRSHGHTSPPSFTNSPVPGRQAEPPLSQQSRFYTDSHIESSAGPVSHSIHQVDSIADPISAATLHGSAKLNALFDSVSADVAKAISMVGRRNRSRFTFAHGDYIDVGLASGKNGMVDGKVNQKAPAHADTKPNDGSQHSALNEVPEYMASKKSNVPPSRQPRSRFDFADHGSSPPRNPNVIPIVDGDLGFSQSRMPGGTAIAASSAATSVPQLAQAPHRGDAFGESFHQLSTEEKLESIFTSVKWSTDTLPPMPQYDPQVEEMMQHMSSPMTATVGPAAGLGSAMATSGSAPSMSVTEGQFGASRMASSMGVTGGESADMVTGAAEYSGSNFSSRSIGLPPPGFREATPGIAPDITADGKTSAITGVASKVISGDSVSNRPGTTTASNMNSGEEQSISSEAESFEDDRKRSRAQRKRDRKARQLREVAERKSVKAEARSGASNASNRVGTGGGGASFLSAEGNVVEQVTKATAAVLGVHSKSKLPAVGSGGGSSEVQVLARPVHSNGGREGNDRRPEMISSSLKEKSIGENEKRKKDGKSTAGDIISVKKGTVDIESHGITAAATGSGVAPISKDDGSSINKLSEDGGKYMSVSELEREVEAARAREAQLQDKLMEITRRLRSYDNVRT